MYQVSYRASLVYARKVKGSRRRNDDSARWERTRPGLFMLCFVMFICGNRKSVCMIPVYRVVWLGPCAQES